MCLDEGLDHAGDLATGRLSLVPAASSVGVLSGVADMNDESVVCHLTELCKDIFKAQDSVQPQPDRAWRTQGVNNVPLVMAMIQV